ncbi:hypothetical protein B0H21DRAFT_749561 [Amylocystis lapponica]|nr:hypothetical protein B0H21DRAFT_749561 [Amylocystis lapponica]
MLFAPSTPPRSPKAPQYAHLPANSSPLASSSPPSPKSSPAAAASTRRRSQYKAQSASSPTLPRARRSSHARHATHARTLGPEAGPPEGAAEPPRKAVLRERFKAKCIERAQRDRERRISGKRYVLSDGSSDGLEDVMDEDEDDESFINDELFRRIVSSTKRKRQHNYRLSYSHDVGSSFDPDMEDVDEWEMDLRAPRTRTLNTMPGDLDEEELAAYAEEYDLHLEDLGDELWSLSDLDAVSDREEEDEAPVGKGKGKAVAQFMDNDVEMST